MRLTRSPCCYRYRQVLPRLGMKVWPYRKRVTMRGIREQLEVRWRRRLWGQAA